MDHKKYAILLFNAVRETLENMAFAEVVPCSLMLGNQELQQDEFDSAQGGLDSEGVGTGWPSDEADSGENGSDDDGWGASPGAGDQWDEASGGGASETGEDDSWGAAPDVSPEGDAWGAGPVGDSEEDPWGDVAVTESRGMSPIQMTGKDIDFDQLVENQDDWVWSCMRVNSEDVHSVWFIVSKNLAMQLAQSMYAGENFELDSPMIRDLVAELTNVLGGRLMLLLEEMGGKFTLAVPEIGVGMPKIPEAHAFDTILCKVLVDSEYPVMSSICFNEP